MADALIAGLPNTHVLFSAESLCEGHPDKLCDRIAESLIDSLIAEDPQAKAALQVLVKADMVIVLGSVATTAEVPYEQVVRTVLKKLGYDGSGKGLGPDSCRVVIHVDSQLPEAALKAAEDCSISDSGVITGYACNETPECMPFAVLLACRLSQRLTEVSRSSCHWAKPESQVQVTMEYKRTRGKLVPNRVHTVQISANLDTPVEDIKTQLREEVVKAVVSEQYLDDRTIYSVSSAGRTSGLSGRHGNFYGCWGDQSSCAFAGKDPSRIERVVPLAARWIAKSLVKANLCDRVLVQLAYAGLGAPSSIHIDTFGTTKAGREDKDLTALVLANFDLRAESLIQELSLRQAVYEKTVVTGPFGREDGEFPWECPRALNSP